MLLCHSRAHTTQHNATLQGYAGFGTERVLFEGNRIISTSLIHSDGNGFNSLTPPPFVIRCVDLPRLFASTPPPQLTTPCLTPSCRYLSFSDNYQAGCPAAPLRQESWTLDGPGGAYLGTVAKVSGTKLTLSGKPNNVQDYNGGAVVVMDGASAGQWRRVSRSAGFEPCSMGSVSDTWRGGTGDKPQWQRVCC